MTGAVLLLTGLLSMLVGGACDLASGLRQRADAAALAIGYEDAVIRFAAEEEAHATATVSERTP